MNGNIDKLFYEKNKEILKKKLLLDIENNNDSLKLTLDNVISLEMNKLYKSLVSLCKQNKLDFSDKKLMELIESEKVKLKNIVLEELNKRQRVLEQYIKEGDK